MRKPVAVAACLLFPFAAVAQQDPSIPQPGTPSGPRGPNPHAPPALRQAPRPPAQKPPEAAKPDAQKLEKVEVTADSLSERRESTAAKLVVNRDEILKYGDTNVLDVMKRLPGVTVDSGPGGRGGAIRMRGLGSGYTQILVNGERMPPGFSLDSIAPDLIDRIEIIRGATAEHSTQAVAGTINVVLRRALATQNKELRLNASVQNDQPTGQVSGQWADRSGALNWVVPFNLLRFSFANESTGEQLVFEPDGDAVQHYTSRRVNEGWGANGNIAPRLSWTLGPNNTLNVDAFALTGFFRGFFTEDNAPRLGAPPPYVDTGLRIRNEFGSFRTNVNWVRRFADNARIDARVGISRFEFDSGSTFDALDVNGLAALRRTVDSTGEDLTLTTLGKYSLPLVASHSMAAGWDAAYTRRDDTRLQGDLFPQTGQSARVDEDFDTTIRRLALYAQDEWDMSERFAVYYGLRWEGIETRSVGNAYEAIRNRSSVVSPIMNMLWRLPGSEKDQVRLGVARTYKPVNVNEIVPRRFFAPNNSPTTPDFIGNPRLKPELSWGLDVGYEHYPASGGNIGVNVYHRQVENIIQRETVLENGLYISRPANIGEGTVTGIELDAKGKLTQLIAVAPGIDLRFNLAYNKSKVDFLPGPHNRLDAQVPWNGTLGADYRFTGIPLTVGTSFTARAAGTVRTSLSQTIYRTVNRQWEAFSLWRFSPAVQLRLSVQDLLAQDAITVNRFTDAFAITERNAVDPRFTRFSAQLELRL